MTFGQSIKLKFHDLNQNYMIDEDHAKLKNEFYDAIRYHIKVKKLSMKAWT